MSNSQKSTMVTEDVEFILEAYGKDKRNAFASAFGMLKKKAYARVDGLIIHMEAKEVNVLEENEKTKAEKLVGYFRPRQIQDYYVKLQVIVTMKYIPL